MASTALASSAMSAIDLVVCTARLLGIIGFPEANAARRRIPSPGTAAIQRVMRSLAQASRIGKGLGGPDSPCLNSVGDRYRFECAGRGDRVELRIAAQESQCLEDSIPHSIGRLVLTVRLQPQPADPVVERPDPAPVVGR